MQGNINVPRFTYDKSYRRDVIMNLAEQESCDLSVSLGTKYNMDIWEIYFKNYQFLLLNEIQVLLYMLNAHAVLSESNFVSIKP